MVPPCLDAVGLLDRRHRRPAATEPRRMDLDVLEAEDAERGRDPFRLQVEFPQVGEDSTRFVATFDAVPFVVPRDVAARAVVAPTSEAEEPIRHVTRIGRSADGLSGCR